MPSPNLRLTLATAALLVACPKPPTPPPADTFVEVDLGGSQQGTAMLLLDFDGDGREDKLVGAPRALHQGSVGVVAVYRGLGGDAFTFKPIAALTGGDTFGHSLLSLGDLDGDGHGDFAVGSIHGGGEASPLTGAVTVHAGGKRGELRAALSAGAPAAKFGWAMAAADFDADGATDLAVGAPFDSPSAELFQAGSVFVFFGPDFTRRHALPATASTRGLGWALAAGDVSGDGVADLLLGATGKVLLFQGRAGFAPVTPDSIVSGKAADFGRSLALLGDRLVIGAPRAASTAGRDTGAFFVVQGPGLPAALDVDALPSPPALVATVTGASLYQRLGSTLLAIEDLDGDGLPELVVGAPLSDGAATNDLAGRVYLFKSASPLELTQARSFEGATRGGRFGAALIPAAGGRLFVGAPRAAADSGEVQLLDLATGQPVRSGSSGGADGQSYCHCDETGECHC